MGAAGTIFAIARAAVLQRVRSHSFLVTMVITVLSTWQLVPVLCRQTQDDTGNAFSCRRKGRALSFTHLQRNASEA